MSDPGASAEFKGLFVSLVDPAGLLDMGRCIELAGRMKDAATRSGYGRGARMASVLGEVFAETAEIVNRPVEDGALPWTYLAFQKMIKVMYEAGEEYRDGGDPEPIGRLEGVRDAIARMRPEADERRERLRRADPPGSALAGWSLNHRGKICRDVVRESVEIARSWMDDLGLDPVFPPKPRPVTDFLGEYDDPNMSSADMVALARGKIPDGYELVRVEGVRGGSGSDRLAGPARR